LTNVQVKFTFVFFEKFHIGDISVCPPTPISNHTSTLLLSSVAPVVKNESTGNGLRLQRDILPTAARSLNIGTTPSANTFTARNTSTLFSETVSVKAPIEQQSAFHPPSSDLHNIGHHQQLKLSPQYSSTQKTLPNGSMNNHQPPSDSYSCMSIKNGNYVFHLN
jgi:hypothetical protein